MIKIDKKKTQKFRYNDWLEYFNKFSAKELRESMEGLEDILPPEGYAAAARWIEIFEHPSRMDKLSQGRIKAQEEAEMLTTATGDDDEKFYIALIRKNTLELDGASPQEVARLSQNLNIYRQQLQEIRSRRPKDGSKLAEILKKAAEKLASRAKPTKAKKPSKKSAKKTTPAKKVAPKTPRKATKKAKTVKTSSGEKNG